jgi:TRAP-type C4-dicarboxylate transport system permease small subunit
MRVLSTLRTGFERLLEAVVVILMLAMIVVVVLGVTYRKLGMSLVWYDEVASVLLAWLTYYGAALGALKRAHIGVPNLLDATPPGARLILAGLGEVATFGFFLVLARYGVEVLALLGGDTLVSLPAVPTRVTQSVIPIGAVLFMIAKALALPEVWRDLRQGRTGEHAAADRPEVADGRKLAPTEEIGQ